MTHPTHRPFLSSTRQSGIALITVLVLLVIVTLLAVSAGRNATQGEFLARANRARQISLQAAEAALRDARNLLMIDGNQFSADKDNAVKAAGSQFLSAPIDATPGYFVYNGTPVWKTSATWIKRGSAGSTVLGDKPVTDFFTAGAAGVAQQPEYVIERFAGSSNPDPNAVEPVYFRITARGYGPTANTTTIVQETAVRQGSEQKNKIADPE